MPENLTHRPGPTLDCVICHRPWPAGDTNAQRELLLDYWDPARERVDVIALSAYLAFQLADAVRNMPDQDVRVLRHQVLGWLTWTRVETAEAGIRAHYRAVAAAAAARRPAGVGNGSGRRFR